MNKYLILSLMALASMGGQVSLQGASVGSNSIEDEHDRSMMTLPSAMIIKNRGAIDLHQTSSQTLIKVARREVGYLLSKKAIWAGKIYAISNVEVFSNDMNDPNHEHGVYITLTNKKCSTTETLRLKFATFHSYRLNSQGGSVTFGTAENTGTLGNLTPIKKCGGYLINATNAVVVAALAAFCTSYFL